MSVRACLTCGSKRLRTPGVQEAAMGWNPQMDLWMCQDCRTVGRPLLFDDEKARQAFVAELEKEREEAKGAASAGG